MPSGHLEKRSNKSYLIVIDTGRIGGKRTRITKTFRGNKRDAEAEMRRMITEIEQGTYVKPAEMSLGEYLEKWLADYVSVHPRPLTQESYVDIVRRHIIPALGNIPLAKLSPMHLQTYYAQKLKGGRLDGKEGGLSPKSVHYHHRILRRALGQAVKWQLIPRNVAEVVDSPKAVKREMVALSEEQLLDFLEKIEHSGYHDLIKFAAYTGLRRGELLGLKWEDVDFEAGYITITRELEWVRGQGLVFQEPKTPKSRRRVPLCKTALEILRKIRKEQAQDRLLAGGIGEWQENNLVFCQGLGQPIRPSNFSKQVKKLAVRAGYPDITPHSLRHTFASILLARGASMNEVQALLGHESYSTTADIYSHILPGTLEKTVKLLDSIQAT